MAHPFEVRKEIEVAASPDEVWEAIATGTGIDGWFLSTGNEVEPRVGGRMHMSFGEGESAESTVTAWEPPHRFAYSSDAAPDGTLHAFEYVVEAQGRRPSRGPARPQRVPRRRLGGGVRRAERGRLHVPPPDGPVPRPTSAGGRPPP